METKSTIETSSVFIVGAGPVGLFTANLFLQKGFLIYIAEKRLFTRRQIVRLNKKYWNLLPSKVKERLVNNGACQYENRLICSSVSESLENVPETSNVKISIVLSALQRYMVDYFIQTYKSRINFVTEHVSIDGILKNFPGRVVVVADGGGYRSLGADLWYRTTGYPLAEDSKDPKFNPYETIHLGSAVAYSFETNISPTVFSSEVVKNVFNITGSSVVALRSLPEYFYIATLIRDSTREFAQSLSESKQFDLFSTMPEGKFLNGVVSRIGIKNENVKDFDASFFPIDLRTAKEFFYHYGGKSFFIAGDAAFTTHFFTGAGMNSGMASGRYVVDLVTSYPPSLWCGFYNMAIAKLRDTNWRMIPPLVYNEDIIYDICKDETDIINCVSKRTPANVSPIGKNITALLTETI